MRRVRLTVFALVFVCACEHKTPTVTVAPAASSSVLLLDAATHAQYFPSDAFEPSTTKLVNDWYGKHLRTMREPSVWAAAATGETVYRFLWLRTWGNPIAVRVTVDGVRIHLVATRLTGDGGYDPGTIDVHRERDLSRSELDRIEAALRAADFDVTPPRAEMGHDGAQWILERAQGGKYRLVERWSPGLDAKQAAFAAACDVFLDLAGRDIVTGRVY